MDARSIAATARNKGVLTSASELDYQEPKRQSYSFDKSVYEKRVYFGFGKADDTQELKMGPNIAEWPKIPALADNALIKLACVIHDPVTTTDELIPSGETSSYRSNPMKLASFTLSRRDPNYVAKAKEIAALEAQREQGNYTDELISIMKKLDVPTETLKNTAVSSAIFATKPGDGSAREQAASCQRVLGGGANICYEFATKRYRSNCINWGILPFTISKDASFDYEAGDWIFVPDIRKAVETGAESIPAKVLTKHVKADITLYLNGLTADEKEIILCGCLMNYYAAHK